MFDLFRSRAKAVRYMLGALLMLVAISMVVTLIPGYGTGGGEQDQVVAQIGKEVISVREVQQQIQAQLRNRQLPREMASILVPQYVDQMITDRAMAYEAQRLGFQVSEADLARAIRSVLPQLFQNGQFVGKDVYAAYLAQQNFSIPEFEDSLKRQLMVSRLQDLAANAVVVTQAEAEADFKKKNEKAKLEYIALDPAKMKADVSVSPDEIKQFYEKNKAMFRVPEKRNLKLLLVDEAKVSQSITVPDTELRRYYENNKDQYRTQERVHARHILLKTTDVPKEQIPKIQARAEELLKQLKGGADFAELAKKNSQDTGSAEKGGDLGWVVRGQTVAAFETAAFSLKPKDLSSVIKTEYGFHIVQVLEKEDAHLKPFEEVKEQIASERKKQQVFDTMQRLADQAHDELVKNPQAADDIARRLNLTAMTADKVAPGDAVPLFGNNPDFQEAISSLPKGGVTPVMQAPGNKLAVGEVTEVLPARPAELSEVESQIRDQLATMKAEQLVEQRAKEAYEKAKSGDLQAAAKLLRLEVKTTQDFAIDGAADGIGAGAQVRQAFELPVGSVFGPVAIDKQRFVCKVASRTPADMSQFAAQRKGIVDTIRNRKSRDQLELFQDSIRTALARQGKVKVHQDVVNRIVASYRTS